MIRSTEQNRMKPVWDLCALGTWSKFGILISSGRTTYKVWKHGKLPKKVNLWTMIWYLPLWSVNVLLTAVLNIRFIFVQHKGNYFVTKFTGDLGHLSNVEFLHYKILLQTSIVAGLNCILCAERNKKVEFKYRLNTHSYWQWERCTAKKSPSIILL